jgi:hypothetical protein
MTGAAFDFETFLRSIIIGLGTGFIVAALTPLIFKLRWGSAVPLGIGVALILTVILFFAWPPVVEVPNIAGLSKTEAELLLEKKGLVPEVTPQQVPTTEVGRVVPYSQDPLPGIKVRKGTSVRFGVNISDVTPPDTIKIEKHSSVKLFRPRSGEKMHCRLYGDGIYRFSVEGISQGVGGGGFQLLLWAQPVKPPSETPGWCLQRGPINGIHSVKSDGSWEGIGQIGNPEWPPHDGDILDVAVTVVESEIAERLLATQGVVTRISLPGITSDKALGVKISLK